MLNVITCENSSKSPRNIPKSARKSVKETYQQQYQPDSSSSLIFFHTKHKSKARLRAEEEEEKLKREQAERAEKLQKFQADVQKRVSAIQKKKQQKEIERGMKDINIARNVMRSCVGVSTSIINHQKFLVPLKQTSISPDEVQHNNSLSSQNQEVLTARSHDSTENHQQSLEEKVSCVSDTCAVVGSYNGPIKIICEDKQPSDVNYFITGGMKDKKKLNKVLDNNCSDYSKNHVVSMVQHPDKSEVQEMKKQQTLQRTLSRKVFMDLEREQTREVERQNRQRMELFLLRNTREAIRKEIETSGREPVVQLENEYCQAEYEFPERIQKTEESFPKNSLQKVSYTRKLLALVQLLEEKCNKLSIPLPSLCPCGTQATDPLRSNCANNCQFYKNPAEYCRAIKCLISSMESSKNPRPFLT